MRRLVAEESANQSFLPELAARMGGRFRVLVDTIIAVFDGEAVHRFVLEKPEVESARLDLLTSFARSLAG